MAVSQSLTLTLVSQSVSGNYSNVRLVWKSTQSGASFNNNTLTGYYWIAKNGGGETKYSVSTTLPKSTAKTILDKTFQVTHKADGTGSVKARSSIATGISVGTVTKSDEITLTTIPRVTTPTLSASSVNMGESLTINLPRASSSFTHDLAYKYGSQGYTTIATGVGTSKAWTVPDLASAIPNATSLTVTIRAITKTSGGDTVGTKYVTFAAKVPSSVVPTVSAITATEATAGLAAQFGAFVQSKSKVNIKISASGAKGSTVKEYSATLLGKTYTGASWQSAILSKSGTQTVSVKVKDSRGRWSAAKTLSLSVVAYAPPEVHKLKAYRCDSAGVPQTDGLYARIEYDYSVSSVGSKNTAAMTLAQKRAAATDYTDITTGTALSANTSRLTGAIFSVDYSFDVRLTVTDWFGATAELVAELPSGAVILDIAADGLGLAVGKTSEFPGFDIGWDIVDQIKAFGSLSGRYKTHDGLLLQWGSVTITPDVAGTPKTAVVTFPLAYASTPAVFVSPVTSVPHTVDVGVQRAADIVGDPAKAVGVTLTRSGLTGTGIYWLAIGKEAA